jgi:hypothetical protein
MDNLVDALACDSSTNLYAGGSFGTAGGVTATRIAKWNGSAWSTLGLGIVGGGTVYALVCDGSSDLYAGGSFTFAAAGGHTASEIAKWNGSSWFALGSGMNNTVNALACDSFGNLYAGGLFTSAGGTNANYIAQWNGSSWSALGSGMNGYVYALAFDSSGNLYASGSFTEAGNNLAYRVAKALVSPSSYIVSLKEFGTGTNVITGLGTPNYAYALDLATNLAPPVDWMPQATNTAPGVNLIFTNVSGSPKGFYRTRYVPQ